MIASAAKHCKRVGKPDNGCALIDSKGRRVKWTQLIRDIDRGWRHFWHRRGGVPTVARDRLELAS